MNRDQIRGKAENLKGRAKEAAGAVTGNKGRQAEGLAERVGGAVREKLGQAKSKVDRDTDDNTRR